MFRHVNIHHEVLQYFNFQAQFPMGNYEIKKCSQVKGLNSFCFGGGGRLLQFHKILLHKYYFDPIPYSGKSNLDNDVIHFNRRYL